MPGGDRTGPTGTGPMTGRGAGLCAGTQLPGYMNSLPGRGPRLGRGAGRGWCYRTYVPAEPHRFYNPAPDKDAELEILKQQVRTFQSSLEGIQQRISELESGK